MRTHTQQWRCTATEKEYIYLVKDERATFSAEAHELLEIIALDHLTSGITRVGCDEDGET